MMTITRITNIDNKKHIALLDTSSISFMQGLEAKGIPSDDILKDYDLILIPQWVLAEVVSWYYPETEVLTIYSQDSDTYEFQRKAETSLREIFTSRTPVPVSYKSNDAILCQLFREGKISIENLGDYRKDIRKITYSKVQDDYSVILVTEVVDNCLFIELVQDTSVHIIF